MFYDQYKWAAYLSIGLLLSCLLFNATVIAQTPESLSPTQATQASTDRLEPNNSIERELAIGNSHSYKIDLTRGDFLHVVIEQQSIDVAITLSDPTNKQLIEVDRLKETQGLESVFAIAEVTGSYQLIVRSLNKSVTRGRYQIRIVTERPAIAEDKDAIKAQQTHWIADQLWGNNSTDSLAKAIDKFLESLRLWQLAGRRYEEALTLNNIGFIYNLLTEKEKALGYYQQALSLRQAIGDKGGEGTTLNNLGTIYRLLKENKKALEYYQQSLSLRQIIGNKTGEAITLANLGVYYSLLGDQKKALEYFTQALSIRQSLGDQDGTANTLNTIGAVYRTLGESQQALNYFHQALTLLEASDDKNGKAATLNNIGVIYDEIGERQKALEYCQQALALRQAIGDKNGEAITFNSMVTIYKSLSEYNKALEYGAQALALRQTLGDKNGQAYTLNNIGSVYEELGEYQRALEYYLQALPLQREKSTEAAIINNIGGVYRTLGEYNKALDYYNQALIIVRSIGNKRYESYALGNIGKTYRALAEEQKALEYYSQALALQQTLADKVGEAITLNSIGGIYRTLGEYQKALEYCNNALAIQQAIGSKVGEAGTLFNIAQTKRDNGELSQALIEIEKALNLVETLRAKIHIKTLRTSYFASIQDYYEFYIDLLMQLHQQHPSDGYEALALQCSERARARSLLELLTEASIDPHDGIDASLLEQENRLKQLLNAKAEIYERLLGNKRMATQVESLKAELGKIIEQLEQIEATIREQSPRYRALTQPQPLSLKEIQRAVLDKDTLLLTYSLGVKRSFLWAVTSTTIKSYQLPKRAEIESAAQNLYELLTTYRPVDFETEIERKERLEKAETEYPAAVAQLSQMLLDPVMPLLGKTRLIVVADGTLQYIPFSVLTKLPNNKQPAQTVQKNQPLLTIYRPLIVDHEIVNLPSASILALLRREHNERNTATKSVVVFADPVFEKDDKRVKESLIKRQAPNTITDVADQKVAAVKTNSLPADLVRSAKDLGFTFPRLPATRKEANVITALLPAAQAKEVLDFDASRRAVFSSDISRYGLIHFATHALINNTHPELSGVVLSLVDQNGIEQDGFLRLHDIFNLKLQADLVVLSGCQTGLGKQVKGEGLVGLSRGFMYAGASRVMVSLWDVNDTATAELMQRFYKNMLGKFKLRPVAALRAAQLSMLKEKLWQSPFYWAAFTVQGEPQ
ncbi:MAG: tetratricopeptide repeat protein [Acidobacteriota bacterium]